MGVGPGRSHPRLPAARHGDDRAARGARAGRAEKCLAPFEGWMTLAEKCLAPAVPSAGMPVEKRLTPDGKVPGTRRRSSSRRRTPAESVAPAGLSVGPSWPPDGGSRSFRHG